MTEACQPPHYETTWQSDELLKISHNQDYVTGRYDAPSGCFVLTDLIVISEWRQGVGRELVILARNAAKEAGASMIMASIITRRGYETMRSAFGAEAIEVESLGDFSDPDDYESTRATLVFHLSQQAIE